MKKIISFEKKIDFPSMIGEVTAISLDHTLKFIDESNVEGEFCISGNYKLTEASRIEEHFDYKIPADIVLGEKLDLETTKVEIDDFYYEIEDDDRMICYIDVKLEGVEQVDIPEEETSNISVNESIEEEPFPTIEPLEVREETVPIIQEIPNEESNNQIDNVIINIKEQEADNEKEFETVTPIIINDEENKEEIAPIEEETKKIEEVIEDELSSDSLRECDGDYAYDNEMIPRDEEFTSIKTKEKEQVEQETMKEELKQEITKEELKQEIAITTDENDEEGQSVGSLFSALKDSDDTFATYSVYILRQEETVTSIVEKYKTTKEELESYNDLSNLTIGSKIIIPVHNEE